MIESDVKIIQRGTRETSLSYDLPPEKLLSLVNMPEPCDQNSIGAQIVYAAFTIVEKCISRKANNASSKLVMQIPIKE